MRIWIVNHYALPLSEGGPTRHIQLAQELQSKGHEVLIIAANFNHYTFKHIEGVPRNRVSHLTHEGVKFLWIPVCDYHGNTLKRLKNLWQFCSSVLKRRHYQSYPAPDIIIGSSPQLFAAYCASILAKRYKVPFIFEMRDVWPDSIMDLGRVSRFNPIIIAMKFAAKQMYGRATRIITVMPRVSEYLGEKGVMTSKLFWLPNFVNLQSTLQVNAQSDNAIFQVVYAGSHGLANDLGVIVDAAKVLTDRGLSDTIKITLIGEGAMRSALMARAQELNLSNIEFKGPVPKTQIYHHLEQADVFLMIIADAPVFQWGISLNKLFDYLALNRPIIANTNAHYHPELDESLFYNVPPNDANALADAIVHFVRMSAQARSEFARKGRIYCEQFHELHVVGSRLEHLLFDCKA